MIPISNAVRRLDKSCSARKSQQQQRTAAVPRLTSPRRPQAARPPTGTWQSSRSNLRRYSSSIRNGLSKPVHLGAESTPPLTQQGRRVRNVNGCHGCAVVVVQDRTRSGLAKIKHRWHTAVVGCSAVLLFWAPACRNPLRPQANLPSTLVPVGNSLHRVIPWPPEPAHITPTVVRVFPMSARNDFSLTPSVFSLLFNPECTCVRTRNSTWSAACRSHPPE